MSYPINYPTPQGANVQIFNLNSPVQQGVYTWVKPQGASMVWFTLIGSGGGGGGTDGTTNYSGGGSGAVTNLMIPAFLIPDNLSIGVGVGGSGGAAGGNDGQAGQQTYVLTYLTGNLTTLLSANGGNGGGTGSGAAGGTAMAANYFTAAGFFQSVSGQAGALLTGTASATTFLSGGSTGDSAANYGYRNAISGSQNGGAGYFVMSPIICSVGGSGSNFNPTNVGKQIGGIGSGGGGSDANLGPSAGSPGGNGLAVIITW